jgi:protein-S-isoprenylcysteine O-methyltransferase Ste14
MEVIIIQALGAITFLGGTIRLGVRIRRVHEKSAAERASRISHMLYWSCLVIPGLVGLFYPGLTRYDELLGVPSLTWRSVALGVGLLLLSVGLSLLMSSNHSLIKLGRGTAAFLLTKQMVSERLYQWTRNPMSLGYYLACVGIGLMGDSSVVTFGALLVVVPIHMFNLRYFEERELGIRYGKPYVEYKRRVPFLLPKLPHGRGVRA